MPPPAERKLAAILSADVVGYSRLMAEDEDATVRTLNTYRSQVGALVTEHRGRVVDFTGDNFLAEFPTATDAVGAAAEIQRDIKARNAAVPSGRVMEFRIGVHLGEIRVEGNRIYGAGVNIAARLEGLAEPSGICISATVHDQVERKLDLAFQDLGEQSLKNIPKSVRVYRVQTEPRGVATPDGLPGMRELTVPGFSGRPAIAVLPFENLGGDPEQEYLADGIAEDLITRLSNWRALPVIARNSSFVYKGRAVDVRQVSRELGVGFAVAGSVRKSANRIRIAVQLSDATTGHQIWGETYDRELQDVLALQDEITEAIVASMHPELLQFERERAVRQDPKSLDAWGHAQRGWWHFDQITRKHNVRARELFRRATELDPHWGGAFAGLALAHFQAAGRDFTDSPDRSVDQMFEAAKTSVALDAKDPYGQIAMGMAYGLKGQTDKMIAALERATELNPSLPLAYDFLGMYLAFAGRPEEAIANLEKAMRLDPKPRGPWMAEYHLGMAAAHFVTGQNEASLEWARQSVQRDPTYTPAYQFLVAIYSALDRADEARMALEELKELQPEFSLASVRRMLAPVHPSLRERYMDNFRKAGLKE